MCLFHNYRWRFDLTGRPGGPSIVRVSSIGAKKIVPPAVRDYLPARRPPYKQTASRMTPAERDRLLTSQPVATPPKRCYYRYLYNVSLISLMDYKADFHKRSRIKRETYLFFF